MKDAIDYTFTEDDAFLLFKDGKEAGLTYLYTYYFNSLLRCGLRIIQDHFAVENIVQDTFLKAWSFRERITSALHAYRFMRMNVKWGCYDYYHRPEYRQVAYTDYFDNYPNTWLEPDFGEEPTPCPDEEMLKSVYEVMPYLPANKQTVLQLYFKYGFSYKQIAKRFSSNSQAVSHELHEGLDYLKKVIHTQKQLAAPVIHISTATKHSYDEQLSGEMLQLFKLRFENKLPFDVIAAKMNLSQPYVQQQYVAAHAKLKKMKARRL